MHYPENRSWPAPAKLNLFLHVTGRRPDGYHELQTLFQLLDWGDEVIIQPMRKPVVPRHRADYAVAAADDLVVKAAILLQTATSIRQGVQIEVIKRIPSGAGLGGGSSDAATVLVVLNRLWDCGLSVDELAILGLKLGADVPLFIRGHSALATGVGDELYPVDLGDRHYLLVDPGFSISTRSVFNDPALPRSTARLTVEQALAGLGGNDCEGVVRDRFPEFSALLAELRQLGPARMTGTGSAIFVEMPDKKTAINTAEQIKCRYNVRAVRGVDRSPLHSLLESGDGRGY